MSIAFENTAKASENTADNTGRHCVPRPSESKRLNAPLPHARFPLEFSLECDLSRSSFILYFGFLGRATEK
jgi:hypothetical protein